MDSQKVQIDSSLVNPLLRLGEFVGFRMGFICGAVVGAIVMLITLSRFIHLN